MLNKKYVATIFALFVSVDAHATDLDQKTYSALNVSEVLSYASRVYPLNASKSVGGLVCSRTTIQKSVPGQVPVQTASGEIIVVPGQVVTYVTDYNCDYQPNLNSDPQAIYNAMSVVAQSGPAPSGSLLLFKLAGRLVCNYSKLAAYDTVTTSYECHLNSAERFPSN